MLKLKPEELEEIKRDINSGARNAVNIGYGVLGLGALIAVGVGPKDGFGPVGGLTRFLSALPGVCGLHQPQMNGITWEGGRDFGRLGRIAEQPGWATSLSYQIV
jgi:hypothetical protein